VCCARGSRVGHSAPPARPPSPKCAALPPTAHPFPMGSPPLTPITLPCTRAHQRRRSHPHACAGAQRLLVTRPAARSHRATLPPRARRHHLSLSLWWSTAAPTLTVTSHHTLIPPPLTLPRPSAPSPRRRVCPTRRTWPPAGDTHASQPGCAHSPLTPLPLAREIRARWRDQPRDQCSVARSAARSVLGGEISREISARWRDQPRDQCSVARSAARSVLGGHRHGWE